MEERMEKQVWQRVRGELEPVRRLRELLADQGTLLQTYRNFCRRGGVWRRLYEQKEEQVACLRGLLRSMTEQTVARPRGSGGGDLTACFRLERRLLSELTDLSREGPGADLFGLLLDRQKGQCRLLLQLLGTG